MWQIHAPLHQIKTKYKMQCEIVSANPVMPVVATLSVFLKRKTAIYQHWKIFSKFSLVDSNSVTNGYRCREKSKKERK